MLVLCLRLLFVCFSSDADRSIAQDEIYQVEVVIRNEGEVWMTKPRPEWEQDGSGALEEYVLRPNARTAKQLADQPMAWAHSRDEVKAKLAPLVETSGEQQLRQFDTDELASALADNGEPADGVGTVADATVGALCAS